jgi:hypothetical protein
MVGVRFLRTQQRVKSQCLIGFRFRSEAAPCLVLRNWVGISLRQIFMILARVMVCWISDSEVWLAGFCLAGRVALMESLILAQDERWRRA